MLFYNSGIRVIRKAESSSIMAMSSSLVLPLLVLLALLPALLGAPVLVSRLLADGAAPRVLQNLTAVRYKGVAMGFAGHYTAPAEHRDDRENHIYAWFQPASDLLGSSLGVADDDLSAAPLLIWLQGGPGGPGWFGAFGEIGNWFVGGNASDAEPHERCFSWCKSNHCLFVDQPVNTGFSFQTDKASGKVITDVADVDYSDTSRGAMQNIVSVLLQFYQVFPDVAKSRVVITGESYGGLYTPNLGLLFTEHNEAVALGTKGGPRILFDALAVGDPCINWERQMPTYPDTMYGMGVLMVDEREELRAVMAKSVEQIQQGLDNCPAAFNTWNSVWDDNGGLAPSAGRGWYAKTTGDFNTANILMGNGPAGFGELFNFWAKPEAKDAFHVQGIPAPSNPAQNGLNIYDAFVTSGDWCANSSWIYADLLTEAGIDLMIYSSTADPLLGPPTTEAGVFAILDDAVAQSPVTGAEIKSAFTAAKKDIWFVDSKHDSNPAGYAKCVPNPGRKKDSSKEKNDARFCYSVIRNAGHESPAYQPRASYDMIMRFLQGRDWDKSGDAPVPSCDECSGVGPFAGKALPRCNDRGKDTGKRGEL